MNTFGPENLGPITQSYKFAQFEIHAFPQNGLTCATHNLLNFYHLKAIFVDLIKSVFLLTFEMTYNVLSHISQMKHFLDLGLNRQSCR